jgi:hypothetical protein
LTRFDLDHVGIAVADLDRASAQFKRLGFTLTPRGYHTAPPAAPGGPRPLFGTGNHCAMLRRGYLELIGITDPAYQGRLRADIARHEGIHIIAFGIEDAVATAREMRRTGLDVAEPRRLERPIEEEGGSHLAQFDIIDSPPSLLPEAHIFAIHHASRDLLWKPELLQHPNGALSLDSLTVAVANPAEFAGRLGRFLSLPPARNEAGLELELKLVAGRVRVVGADWLARQGLGKTPGLPYVAGVGLAVADLTDTAGVLTRSGVAFQRRKDALIVHPREACGAFLEFRSH